MVAALHFNENVCREQAVTAVGQARYNISFPKSKRGSYSVRKVPVPCTFGKYVL